MTKTYYSIHIVTDLPLTEEKAKWIGFFLYCIVRDACQNSVIDILADYEGVRVTCELVDPAVIDMMREDIKKKNIPIELYVDEIIVGDGEEL